MTPIDNNSELGAEITKAIGAHGMWKAKLKQAIATGGADLDPAVVGRDDRCDFGAWLHGAVSHERTLASDWKTVHDLHEEFHRVAAGVVCLAREGRGTEAAAQLELGGEFAHVSANLTRAMHDLRAHASA